MKLWYYGKGGKRKRVGQPADKLRNKMEKISTLSKFTTGATIGAGGLLVSSLSIHAFGVKLIWDEQNIKKTQ